MNDQFNNNESEVIQPNIGNTVNDVVTPEPVREAPRKARSVSSEPEEVTSSQHSPPATSSSRIWCRPNP